MPYLEDSLGLRKVYDTEDSTVSVRKELRKITFYIT